MAEFVPFIVNTCESLAGKRKQRTRGYSPKERNPFTPFEIHDPFGLRNAIVPVFRQFTDGRMYGMGTAFHIDGFGNFLTAYHVIDFVEQPPASRPLLFLSMHARVYGTFCIPPDCFVPAQAVYASMMEVDDPMAALRVKSIRRPAIDVALLEAEELGGGVRPPQTLPIRISGWTPKLDEIVLAVGFPELNLSEVDPARQAGLLTEGMFGAYGRVIAIHPNGRSRSNSTPVFEVECDWPPGMSGGPVFNQYGEVIGIVSRSLRAEPDTPGVGYAVHFHLARDIELLTSTLDHQNPGWRVCWAVLEDSASSPVSLHPSRTSAEVAKATLNCPGIIKLISHRIGTTDCIEFVHMPTDMGLL